MTHSSEPFCDDTNDPSFPSRLNGRPARGSQHLAGAAVIPSDEDSQTFHLNFASGEAFKLRAANVRDRQLWVDRVRAAALLHDAAVAR